jgi:DNA segregation ATPase FtsK/SpoIIIE-like protein
MNIKQRLAALKKPPAKKKAAKPTFANAVAPKLSRSKAMTQAVSGGKGLPARTVHVEPMCLKCGAQMHGGLCQNYACETYPSGHALTKTQEKNEMKHAAAAPVNTTNFNAEVADVLPHSKAAPVPRLAPTFENALALVQERGIAATSLFMQSMEITYAEAVHLMDTLEAAGVIAPPENLEFHNHGYRRVYNLGGA